MPLSLDATTFTAVHKVLPILLLCCCIPSISAWSPHPEFSRIFLSSRSHETTLRFSGSSSEDNSNFVSPASSPLDGIPLGSTNAEGHDTRRRFLAAAAMNICLAGVGVPAAIAGGAESYPPGTKYISGKKPLAPGETATKTDNTKGTRKDPDFLRSVADCRNQCQSGLGPDGFAKSKEDCLSECQDICCTTYQQCTFNIVPRL
mmetsp:Transcript_26440/g.57937  ORF Transcript_26440/g.57937 Transcript_26440/m.57937 type:complete len:203 (-) Transcript_26440:242-850(-)